MHEPVLHQQLETAQLGKPTESITSSGGQPTNDESNYVHRMRQLFLALIALWILAVLLLPTVVFLFTKNIATFYFFVTLVVPVYALHRVRKYLFPRKDKEIVSNLLPRNIGYLRTKRVLDILFILLFSSPILIVFGVIALLIKLDSKGPVLHIQKRIGQDGVEFNMLKFRSMFVNSDDKAHREAVMRYVNGERLNDDANTPYMLKNDPRITRVGRFMRKTGLDELPQF